jgi:hypothetical protein
MEPREMVRILRTRCANRDSDDNFNVLLVQELNAAQRQLEEGPTFPFWMTQIATVGSSAFDDTVVGFKRVPLPTGFKQFSEKYPIRFVDGTTKIRLVKKDFDELLDMYDNSDNFESNPLYYAIKGSYIYLFPSPASGSWNLYVDYIGGVNGYITDDLDSAANAWHEHVPLLLISMAGISLCTNITKEPDLAQGFAAQFQNLFQQYKTNAIVMEQQDFNKSKSTRGQH